MSATKRIYNVLINRIPHNQLKIKSFAKQIKLPSTVDLRQKMPPIYDQGELGSCTAQALAASYEYLEKNAFVVSRLFIYYNERLIENDIPDDAGANLCDGILSLEKYGVCAEKNWPYNISAYAMKPPRSCYTEAKKHTVIKASNILQDLTSMKTALFNGYPIVVGISVYESFESETASKTGMIPYPNIQKEELLGGHAVVIVGYNDAKHVWILRNSWSNEWGDKGYFYLPYLYLLDSNLASDLWCITQEKNIAIVEPHILPNDAFENPLR